MKTWLLSFYVSSYSTVQGSGIVSNKLQTNSSPQLKHPTHIACYLKCIYKQLMNWNDLPPTLKLSARTQTRQVFSRRVKSYRIRIKSDEFTIKCVSLACLYNLCQMKWKCSPMTRLNTPITANKEMWHFLKHLLLSEHSDWVTNIRKELVPLVSIQSSPRILFDTGYTIGGTGMRTTWTSFTKWTEKCTRHK